MAVAPQRVRLSLRVSIPHGPQLTSGGWNPGLGRLREAPRLRASDSRGAWFRWRAVSEQDHAEGTAAGPCRLDSGRVGDRSKESRYEGSISVRRGPLATGVAESQGSGWLAETASGDAVSVACVAGVEEAALSGVAASPEFASGSVWGTATVFGVDGGTVDLSEDRSMRPSVTKSIMRPRSKRFSRRNELISALTAVISEVISALNASSRTFITSRSVAT